MQASLLYKSIYTYLGDTTPLLSDCGLLCDKACCKDDESGEETGMYLFPGEKPLFENNPDFKIIKSDFVYGNTHADIVICKGFCDRETRPLSCRIFPLIPYIEKNEGLKIIQDPRAYSVCPLSSREAYKYLDRKFIRKTEAVFNLLIKFEPVRSFILGLSDILDDYLKFDLRGGNF
ncbi:MAG: hypothetical protein IKU15_01820 [Clostridia bacterium]|nr:hypothetical protein [Clostridia bacterium]